ncbi:MAG: DUF1929 domain-containing protein [Saccharothrix sp.]|nr:DUF1929 domain-containing protein [Saccharothrix sp.]
MTIPIADTTLRDPVDHEVTITDNRGLFVIHAVALRTGKLLWFCGHVEGLFYAPMVYLFDPTQPAATPLRGIPMPPRTDLFCCHFVQMYDGRILIIGGSEQDEISGNTAVYHGSSGAKTIAIFDPERETWSPVSGLRLEQGRWYPTAVLLGDGRTVVVSGRRESGAGGDSTRSGTGAIPGNPASIADKVEVIAPRGDGRKTLEGGQLQLPIYPGLHLGPDGKVYYTHTNWGQEIAEPVGQALTVTDTHATWTPFGPPAPQPAQSAREEGMSVLLPVTLPRADSRGRVLVVGGGRAMGRRRDNHTIGPILQIGGPGYADFLGQHVDVDTRSAEVLNTTANPPSWTDVGPTEHPRVNGHCVLLPDATVLVLGGHDAYKWQAAANLPGHASEVPTHPTLHVEIYTPGTGFDAGAPMTHPRMYHSAALLMADGRVIIAGGADPNVFEPPLTYPAGPPPWRGRRYTGGPPDPRMNGAVGIARNRKDYEIYRPPYLCKGLPQPTITAVSRNQVLYGTTFTVTTPQAASIAHVAIMRPGAVTHHTDSEQRYVELEKSPPDGDTLTVTMVPATEANTAPPGYYMLWIVDDQGIPCDRARWIQVTYPPPWPPATPQSQWPCVVATVSLGSEDAPQVHYLRALRAELDTAGWLGARFVGAVSRAYYAVSPGMATWLADRDRARDAVRDVVVRPGTAAIRVADTLTSQLHPDVRTAVLVVLLVLEAVLALALAPVAVLAFAAHPVVTRRRKEPDDV